MPEPNFLSMYSFGHEAPKKKPIIHVSCGIGDTDGFPAFDVDSDAYAVKDDSKWGFLITGGAEFHMPLTVFQVTPDGLADKGGIRLGDIILQINEEDVTGLSLAQAHDKIDASGKKIHFLVKSMEEDPMEEFEIGEEKSIVLRVPKPVPPPPGASIEARLRAMQRKLSEIAEIPKILSSTLATVSQTFEKLNLTGMPPNPNYTAGDIYQQHLQRRKLSYDEDAFDYELSDGGNSEIDEEDEEQVEKKKKTKKKLHAAGHDDNDEFNAKEAYQRLKKHIAARRRRKSKEITPESDYASENNYSLKDERRARKGSDEEDVDDDEDDDGDGDKTISSDNTCEEFNMKCFLTPGGHDPNANGTDDEIDDEDDDDEDDFLTATFTWNLSNKSKLHNSSKDSSTHSDNPSIDSCVSSDEDGPSREKERNLIATLKQHEASVNNAHEQVEESTSKQPKLDKFWPWADREKIIYKQSTCHLVPKKPLGLIEQRIQLLAKRNLLEHLGPNNNNNVSNSSSNNIKCNK